MYWVGLAIYDDGTKEEKKEIEQNENENQEQLLGESFNGHFDSMPNGHTSVGIDFSFPYARHVYGIPEHTSALSLPTTVVGSGAFC